MSPRFDRGSLAINPERHISKYIQPCPLKPFQPTCQQALICTYINQTELITQSLHPPVPRVSETRYHLKRNQQISYTGDGGRETKDSWKSTLQIIAA